MGKIDPGPGYRLLEVGEYKPEGYEVHQPHGGWDLGESIGSVVREGQRAMRVKLPDLPKPFTPNKYTRDLLSLDGRRVPVDVYSVLAAFPSNNGAVDHALKKLLAPGQRGQKDRLQDLKEARASLDRAIQMEEG